MSQTPETIFHSLLQDQTARVVMRNSDDYYPEIPASHAWHIFVNAYNALITRELNVLGDWDMWQTKGIRGWEGAHAAARAVSGGTIMITDALGEHDLELLKGMTARGTGGGEVVLRTTPGAVGKRGVWERYCDQNILFVGAEAGEAGVLGLFNMAEGDRHALIAPGDFEALKSKEFVVGSQQTGRIFGPIKTSERGLVMAEELVQVKLEPKGWDILTAYPVVSVSETSMAILGLRGKMTGAAAIVKQSITASSEGISVRATLRAVGKLGIWVSNDNATTKSARLSISTESQGDGKWADVEEKCIHGTPGCSGGKVTAKILTVDLLEVFEQRKLWTKENSLVDVEIEIGLNK